MSIFPFTSKARVPFIQMLHFLILYDLNYPKCTCITLLRNFEFWENTFITLQLFHTLHFRKQSCTTELLKRSAL